MSSEIKANVIMCVGFVICIFRNINRFNIYELSLMILNCISVMCFTFTSCSFGEKNHYRIKEIGLPCCLLIPIINIISNDSSDNRLAYGLFSNGIASTSIIPLFLDQILNIKSSSSSSSSSSSFFKMMASVSLISSKIFFMVLLLINLGRTSFFYILSILLLQWYIQTILPGILPGSFTYGELAVLVQGVACILMNFIVRLQLRLSFVNIGGTIEDVLVVFSQLALYSCLVSIMAISSRSWFQRNVVRFLLLLAFQFLFIAIPFLEFMMSVNFYAWSLEMIFGTKTSIFLLAYWSVCVVIAILLAVGVSLATPISKEVKDAKRSEKTKLRKLFHVIICLVYLPGLLVDHHLLFLASVVAMVVLVVVECLRFFNVPPVGDAIRRSFSVFLDDQDRGLVVLTPIYLLIGCSSSLWLSIGRKVPKIIPLVGLLSLGIGDSAASYFGSKYGKHHWKGSPKTKEGTLASIIAQIIFIASLQLSGIEVFGSFPILKLMRSVILSSLCESFTLQIDNLILPLFSYLLMC